MDYKKEGNPSNALWIPLLWMFLAGSRYVSSWFNLRSQMSLADAYTEGSPIDAACFLTLIVAAAVVLSRRRVDWRNMMIQNKWIWLYFLYCGVSVVWADNSFVSFKKFIKELGNPIMALVILTEERPYEALGFILKRLSFLLLPLSVLFVKYFPELGRAYRVGGSPMYTGVGHQKNSLGVICLIAGIYFVWRLLFNCKEARTLSKENLISFVFLGVIAWLLYMSDSSTSLGCLALVASLLFVGRSKFITESPARLITVIATVTAILLVMDMALGVREVIFDLLGRDATLTSRTHIWEVVKEMDTNPVIGTGFMSFWSGERMATIWEGIGGAVINQAHNGYLEQYLNLGYVGVAFIGAILLSGLINIRRHLATDYPAAILRLCFVITAIPYNYTEASFYGINNIWLLTLFGVIEISYRRDPKRQ
ncbi:MAG: O-antigen ligase family protein [Syntrophobacterales bacterium]|nr:O-antigen ligase family protein [Syntrophobacterales bacterium]